MLTPQANPHRTVLDLGGLWDIGFDGEAPVPVAVPGSWNDQLDGRRDHLGPATYARTFDVPGDSVGKRARIHFASVNYLAEVELNGEPVGGHEGGHLPFAVDVTGRLRAEGNRLVVRVDGGLAPDRVPPGELRPGEGFSTGAFPNGAFDFFPYCGIHRQVVLELHDGPRIDGLRVTTSLDGTVSVEVDHDGDGSTPLALRIDGDRSAGTEASIDDPVLWAPGRPHLYDLVVELGDRDSYRLPIGLRSVAIDGDRLLVNGDPVVLRGFGRHEDFPIAGRGLVLPAVVRDFELMRWVGANSFRTTHYPYAEEQLALADRLGVLVLNATPAIGLFFTGDGAERRNEVAAAQLAELVERDRHHPSVIMWSLANEPHSHPADDAVAFFERQAALARSLDPDGRPLTIAGLQWMGDDPSFAAVDIPAVNRYQGWYTEPGRIAEGAEAFAAELDRLHERHQGPIFVSEFGADAVAGHHAEPPEMFSEEYQAALVDAYLDVMEARPWVCGHHVWNLCDFKTGQNVTRVGSMNLKGVFTRDRRPKLAAHRLRQRWV